MLNKDSIKTLVASSLYSFHDEILKDEFATKKYVDSKSLPILFLDDNNRTGDKLFPLLPDHNLVFIAGDAQFTDESGNINIIYGLCYSDLQSDGSKLLTEYRTSKSASISANGTLKSFDYIDEYTKTILTLFKNAPSGKVLVKSQNNTFEWVELPNIDGLVTKNNPVFTGNISLGRLDGSKVGKGSVAIGSNVVASGLYSHAEGSSRANGQYSHAEGYLCYADGDYSHAEGCGTTAQGQNQHVEGKYNTEDTANKYAHIVGNGVSSNTTSNAYTLDWSGNGWYAGKLSQEGIPIDDKDLTTKKYVDGTKIAYVKSETECVSIDTSTMKNSFVNNSYTYQQDVVSYLEEGIEYHVEVNGIRYRCLCINNIPGKDIVYETIYVQGDGFSLTINNKVGYSNNKFNEDVTKSSVAIELSDTLLQNPPVIKVIKMNIEYMPTYLMPKDLDILNSLGMNRVGKIGTGSVSLGYNNVANNDFSTALGVNTSATAVATLAHGGLCEATASYSHAEGYRTESSGMYSHSEGIMTLASGQGAHVEGFYAVASGLRSHAEGSYTLASSQYQHVEGKFNVEDKANKYAHIVGNGTSKTARKNAYTLDWDGNGWFAGNVSVEGTPTNNKDLTNKKYVDDKVAGIVNSAPETLDTLQELAKALGNDPNFATTVATQIGKKVDKVDGMSLTHNDLTNELKANYDAAYAYSQAKHSYNDLNDLPTIPSIDGLATTEYVDSKTSLENVVFEGGADNPLVIFDYWTHCPLSNGNACWVINKEVIIGENIENPYYIEANGVIYSPKNSTYDSVNNAWIYNDVMLSSGQKLYMCATYENQNKMVIPWDEMGNYNKLKVYTKTELAKAMFSGDYNDLNNKPTIPSIEGLATEEYVKKAIAGGSDVATDDEVKTAINAILGGDYIE